MLGFVVWEGSCGGENLLIAAHWTSAADWDFSLRWLLRGCLQSWGCRLWAGSFGAVGVLGKGLVATFYH